VKLVLALLAAASLAAVAYAILLVVVKNKSEGQAQERLRGFAPTVAAKEEPEGGDVQLTDTRVLQQAADLTGRIAARAGLLERTERALEQADTPLRPPEALFFYFSAVILVALLGLLVAPSPGITLVMVVLVAGIPLFLLRRRRKKRLRKFEAQLPDTLNLLSGSMRAGFAFIQGLEAVSQEASEPTRRELQRVFTETRLGRPIEEALEDAAERMASRDLMWSVMAIRIQREVGGNLAELLDTVSETMTQRERIRAEIFALTAEGRLSAYILGVFPIAMGLVLYAIQPSYMEALFSDTKGIAAVIGSAIMAVFGFVWLKNIMKIEV
jgi:tight adherence protein B